MSLDAAVPVVHEWSDALGPGDDNAIEWQGEAADGGSGVHDVAYRLGRPGGAWTALVAARPVTGAGQATDAGVAHAAGAGSAPAK